MMAPCNKQKTEANNVEDFEFIADKQLLDINWESKPEKSPIKSFIENVMVQAVMTSLTKVVSKEGLTVKSIGATVLTGVASTLTAGTAGGVLGVAVGALIAGGIFVYRKMKNKSAMDVLRSLSPSQQKQLIVLLVRGLKELGIKDMAIDIMQRNEVKDAALTIVSNFLTKKFGLKIVGY